MNKLNKKLYGAVELGGTKINCLIAESVDSVIESVQFPTTSPEETLEKIVAFFESYDGIVSVGIGSFGPLNLDKNSESYGCILATPKPGWSGVELYPLLKSRLGCEINIDTDVNAAGLAEQQLGAAQGLDNVIYTTVGTGIGSGAILNGTSLKGSSHPEMGHIELARELGDEEYVSCCSFHESCAEGLASGSAIKKRWGFSLDQVDPGHEAWDLEAKYLAKYAHTLIAMYSPQKLVFGGGVSTEILLEKVRDHLFPMVDGYFLAFSKREDLDDFLVIPSLGSNAGPMGCLLLALNN